VISHPSASQAKQAISLVVHEGQVDDGGIASVVQVQLQDGGYNDSGDGIKEERGSIRRMAWAEQQWDEVGGGGLDGS